MPTRYIFVEVEKESGSVFTETDFQFTKKSLRLINFQK